MMPHDIPYYQFKMVRMDLFHCNEQESPSHESTGLLSSGVSLISWGEGVNLTLVGHPSSDSVTIKISYGVDVLLYQPPSHPTFSYWVG